MSIAPPPGCPSELALDKLHAGELDDNAVAEHAASCEHCVVRMAERAQGFDAIGGVDADALLRQIEARLAPAQKPSWVERLARLLFPKQGFGMVSVLALFAVVVGATWLVVRDQDTTTDATTTGDVIRSKGGVGLRVFRKRGNDQTEVFSGSDFRSGDELRFKVSLQEAGYAMVVGVEASGRLWSAFPIDGDAAERFGEGKDQSLDEAIELDDSSGREWLHLVACPAAFGLSDLQRGDQPDQLRVPGDCAQTAFEMDKR